MKITHIQDPSNPILLIDHPEEYETISTFALHPNHQEIVIATTKFTLRHWLWKEKVTTKNIRAHRMPILCMEYDPTGTLIATGSADKTIRVWDIMKGYCTHNFTGHNDLIRNVLFQRLGKELVLFTTSDDTTIRCYDLNTSSCRAVFQEHVSLPTQLSFSDDHCLMVSAGRDKVSVIFCI